MDLLTLALAKRDRIQSFNKPTYGVESLSYGERLDRLKWTAEGVQKIPVSNPNSEINGRPARRDGVPASETLFVDTDISSALDALPYFVMDYYAEDENFRDLTLYCYTSEGNYFRKAYPRASINKGLNHLVFNRVDFIAIGDPDWGDITRIRLRVQAGSGGTHIFRLGEVTNYSFRPHITVWFDDGYENVYTVAKPIMDQYGITGMQSIHGRYIGQPGFQTRKQLYEMMADGWEHCNHGIQHMRFDQHGPDAAEYVIRTGLDYCLSNGFGKSSYYFVNPSGISTTETLPIERKYATLRRIGLGHNYLPLVDPFRVVVMEPRWDTPVSEVEEWIDRTIEGGLWTVLLFHYVLPPSAGSGAIRYPADKFEQVMIYLDEKRTSANLRIATCSEVLTYQ